ERWTAAQARSPAAEVEERIAGCSGVGLLIYGLTVTFAAVDWIMSLEPAWSSTIFGALVASGQLAPALGFSIALASWFGPESGIRSQVSAVRCQTSGAGPSLTPDCCSLTADPCPSTPDSWNDLG